MAYISPTHSALNLKLDNKLDEIRKQLTEGQRIELDKYVAAKKEQLKKDQNKEKENELALICAFVYAYLSLQLHYYNSLVMSSKYEYTPSARETRKFLSDLEPTQKEINQNPEYQRVLKGPQLINANVKDINVLEIQVAAQQQVQQTIAAMQQTIAPAAKAAATNVISALAPKLQQQVQTSIIAAMQKPTPPALAHVARLVPTFAPTPNQKPIEVAAGYAQHILNLAVADNAPTLKSHAVKEHEDDFKKSLFGHAQHTHLQFMPENPQFMIMNDLFAQFIAKIELKAMLNHINSLAQAIPVGYPNLHNNPFTPQFTHPNHSSVKIEDVTEKDEAMHQHPLMRPKIEPLK